MGRETRAGFKRWYPQDKLEGTCNRRCPPQGWFCFCRRTKKADKKQVFTHLAVSETKLRPEEHWIYSFQFACPPLTPDLRKTYDEIKHKILVETLIFTVGMWNTNMLTATRFFLWGTNFPSHLLEISFIQQQRNTRCPAYEFCSSLIHRHLKNVNSAR